MAFAFCPRWRPVTTDGAAPVKVAYVMSRFPRLTETFILYEILALRRAGCAVDVYPLMRERNTRVRPDGASVLRKTVQLLSPARDPVVMHDDAVPVAATAHYGPLMSKAVLRTNLRELERAPTAYLGALTTLIRRNLGSLNHLLGGLAIFPRAVSMGAQMRRTGVTHVHAHFANHPAAAAFVIHRLYGLPYSFTGHGADLQVDQRMLREKVSEASFVRAISGDGRRFIAAHANPDAAAKIEVVPCGVDMLAFGGDQAPAGDDAIRILCVATLYEVKGHAYLFEACAQLLSRGRNVTCLLAGDGPDRAALESLAADLGLGDVVTFLGARPRTEIVRLMHEADVLVVPSVPTESGRREGMPVVILEAMAAGLPVVASAISGIPEVVEGDVTGFLVPPRDVTGLATAIERATTDGPERGAIVAAARELVRTRYDFGVVTRRLIDLFAANSSPRAA
jgi:glycosyltransferase involved in cell wall biosynthesis